MFSFLQRVFPFCFALCVGFGGLVASAVSAEATTLTATNLSDDTTDGTCSAAGMGDGCTLREALTTATNNPETNNTVVFASGLSGSVRLNAELPTVTKTLILQGKRGLALDGQGKCRILQVSSSGTLSLSAFTLQNGYIQGSGGGRSSGGALYNVGGTVTLANCTLLANQAVGYTYSNSNGNDSCARCNAPILVVARGSAIAQEGGTLSLVNCTLSNNTASGPTNTASNAGTRNGGAISIASGEASLLNCTLNNNSNSATGTASPSNKIDTIYNEGSLTSRNTVFVTTGASASTPFYGFTDPTSAGDTNKNFAFTSLQSAGLDALADNGGAVATHALREGSTLLDAGLSANAPASDARGIARPQGSGVDVGAYEKATGNVVASALSGTVTLADGTGLGNVAVVVKDASGTLYGVAVSASNGTWSLPNVAPGTYNVTPQTVAYRYTFQPATRTVTVETTNVNGVSFIALPTTESLIVTTLQDEDNQTSDPAFGEGTSLREAITYANGNADPSTITFQSGLKGTIALKTALPNLATPMTITGPGAALKLTRNSSATTTFDTLTVSSNTSVTLNGLILSDNAQGSGIYNTGTLSVSNSTLSGNVASSGGGIYNIGTLTLNACLLSGNKAASYFGGGLFNYGTANISDSTITLNTASSLGGGIYNEGTLTLRSSTVSANTTSSFGGGLYNEHGTLTISNATFSGNRAADSGTAIYYAASNAGLITNSTFTGNTATGNNGITNGAIDGYSDSLTLRHSILVSNSAPDLGLYTVAGGYNLVGTSDSDLSNQPGTRTGVTAEQVKLGPLADNGGPTQTIALQPGSIAINAGNPNFNATDTPYDQRGIGYQRVYGGQVDIGAYESQTAPVSSTVTLSGTVYNAVALSGLPGIVVNAVRQSDNAVFAVGTDSAGNYSLKLAPGTYTFSALLPHKPGFIINPAFTNPVTLSGTPATLTGYNFRAVGVTGRVISPSNVGISNVTLNLYAQNDTTLKSPLRTSITDSQGFFSLDGVAAGTYLVAPVAPNTYTYTPTTRKVTVVDKAVFTSFTAKVKSAPKAASGPRSSVALSFASANAQSSTLTLHFTGQLDAASVTDLTHYGVVVDGVTVEVEEAQLSGGDTIVLSLPEGALAKGSQIVVGWSGVLDSHGLPLQGQATLNVA